MAEETKKPKALNLQVDLEELTFGDMEVILGFDGRLTPPLIEVFDHVIVGGVKHIKFIKHVNEVVETIMEAVQTASNPETQAGN